MALMWLDHRIHTLSWFSFNLWVWVQPTELPLAKGQPWRKIIQGWGKTRFPFRGFKGRAVNKGKTCRGVVRVKRTKKGGWGTQGLATSGSKGENIRYPAGASMVEGYSHSQDCELKLRGSKEETPQLLSFPHLLSCWHLPIAELSKNQNVRESHDMGTFRGHTARQRG